MQIRPIVNWDIIPYGELAYIVRFGDEIAPMVHAQVLRLIRDLDQGGADALHVETYIPAYACVTLRMDANRTQPTLFLANLERRLKGLFAQPYETTEIAGEAEDGRLIRIPVWYGGAVGPDLEYLAGRVGLTEEEVIKRHSDVEYLVYLLGFLPGFPYLGGMDPSIALPRRAQPRTRVPRGSVGIGGSQTGIYPLDSPGGWHLIGRTPISLFEPDKDEPTLIRPGDRVRFEAISKAEFLELGGQV